MDPAHPFPYFGLNVTRDLLKIQDRIDTKYAHARQFENNAMLVRKWHEFEESVVLIADGAGPGSHTYKPNLNKINKIVDACLKRLDPIVMTCARDGMIHPQHIEYLKQVATEKFLIDADEAGPYIDKLVIDLIRPLEVLAVNDVAGPYIDKLVIDLGYQSAKSDISEIFDESDDKRTETRPESDTGQTTSGARGEDVASTSDREAADVALDGLRIFVNYRREDSQFEAHAIYLKLQSHFGKRSVFIDVDAIPLGIDFRRHLQGEVERCDVLLAVIGNQWLGATDADGKRRLDGPGDFVRIELEAALCGNIPVVPVLLGNTNMPPESSLPGALKDLAYRNASVVRAGPDFQADLDRLIRGLEKIPLARWSVS